MTCLYKFRIRGLRSDDLFGLKSFIICDISEVSMSSNIADFSFLFLRNFSKFLNSLSLLFLLRLLAMLTKYELNFAIIVLR